MIRHPAWFIFIFVSSSILVAGAYNAYVLSPLARPTAKIADVTSVDPGPLKMTKGGWAKSILTLSGNSCAETGLDRAQHFTGELKSFPPIFREARQRGGGDVSYACLRETSAGFVGQLPHVSSRCGLEVGVTDPSCPAFEGLRVTYNSILDISDCLEISQREILPLLASESGFLPDVTEEAGAVEIAALENWPRERPLYLSSEKASCRRLAEILPVEMKMTKNGCPTLRESVFRQFVRARDFARVSQEIGDRWEASQLDASLSEMDARLEDRLILRYWVHLIALEAGSNKALSLAHEFVGERSEDGDKIRAGELSWKGFLADNRRSPASAAPRDWSQYLKGRLDVAEMERLARVAKWLNWVKDRGLAIECATELWTME